MKRLLLCSAILMTLVATATTASADQKVKKRTSFGQQSFDSTSYIKGQRSRDEMNFGQMQMITIKQCDLHQTLQVNDRTKTYMITKDPTSTPQPARPAAGAKGTPKAEEVIEEEEAPVEGARKGGVVTINTTVQDTGETKDFFGYKARHIKTSMSMESSSDACNPNQKTQMSADGWYIDFQEKTQVCERPMSPTSMGGGGPMRQSQPTCQDKMRFTGSGVMAMRRLGYPVDLTTTMIDKDGKQNSFRQQALEISTAALDAGLFDAPAGYRQASSYMDMMGMNMGSIMANAARSRAGGTASRPETPTPEVKGTRVARRRVGTYEIGPKQAGKLRVGVVVFDDKSGKVTDADNLRRTLMQDIERFGYEAVPIDSRTQEAAIADAKTFECDYVVFNNLNQQLAQAPSAKKIGGFLGRAVTGGLSGAAADSASDKGGLFQGSVDYRLFKVATPTPTDPELTKSQDAKGTSGGSDAMNRESKDIATQIQKDRM